MNYTQIQQPVVHGQLEEEHVFSDFQDIKQYLNYTPGSSDKGLLCAYQKAQLGQSVHVY